MAELEVDGDTVRLRLRPSEKWASLRRHDIVLRRDQITSVEVVDRPFRALRGLRAPGTGVPGVIAMGVWRGRGVKDFVLLRRGQRGLVLTLSGDAPYRRMVVGIADPEAAAALVAPDGSAAPAWRTIEP